MTQAQVMLDRWEKIQKLSLRQGAHSPDSTFCVMEAVAFVAGEKWSDAPECACPIISAFLRSWNDSMPTDADRDRLLKPLILRLVNTRNETLEKQADSLESLPEITAFSQFPSIRGRIEAVRKDAAAAGAAAGAAAWDAARAKLAPTVASLQESALQLVECMIGAQP
jgi:hypothetical protein